MKTTLKVLWILFNGAMCGLVPFAAPVFILNIVNAIEAK